ncbi:hypothetical protein V5799_019095, partial [Amblyomma americanum]
MKLEEKEKEYLNLRDAVRFASLHQNSKPETNSFVSFYFFICRPSRLEQTLQTMCPSSTHLSAWFFYVGVFFLPVTRLAQLHNPDRVYGVARSFVHVTLVGLAAYGLGLPPALYVLATRQ